MTRRPLLSERASPQSGALVEVPGDDQFALYVPDCVLQALQRSLVFIYGLVWREVYTNVVRLLVPHPNKSATAPMIRDMNISRVAVPDGSGTQIVSVPSWFLSVPILLTDKNDIGMFLETDLSQKVVSRAASVHVTLQDYHHFCFVFVRTS